MALGAITQLNLNPALNASEPGEQVFGGLRVRRYSVVGDSSYPTGGSSLTAAQLGFGNSVVFAIVRLKASSGSNNAAHSAQYDEVNQKLQCFAGTDAAGVPVAEVANATNVSGLTWDVLAFGF